MKKINVFFAVILASLLFSIPVTAGFRIGPRVGIAVNSMHLSKDVFKSDNRVGFTGGVEAELGLPLGFAVDASVMYAQRNLEYLDINNNTTTKRTNHFIDIPLNIKWKLSLPAVSKIIAPYVFTGPDFAFNATKNDAMAALKESKFDVAWNVGFGVELIKKLQVGASYGIGMTKAFKGNHSQIDGRNNTWTITAAWLF